MGYFVWFGGLDDIIVNILYGKKVMLNNLVKCCVLK